MICDRKTADSTVARGEDEDEEEKVKEEEREPMMFDIFSVNAYGSQTLMKLNKDGSELKLGGVCVHVYMCCVLQHLCYNMCVNISSSIPKFVHSTNGSGRCEQMNTSCQTCSSGGGVCCVLHLCI